jgi:hypothetical protein
MMRYVTHPESALGLEISTSRGSVSITFQPDDERAFVVGRSPHADLRLVGPRVGGVAFHLERRGRSVELFPADTGGTLFVDGRRVTAPLLLAPTAVVDLPGERLVLTTYDATGLAEASSVRLAEAGIAYVAALPSENDTTRLGIETGGPDSDEAIYEMKTTAFVPHHHLSHTLPLGPTGTDVIRASDLFKPPPQLVTDKITRAELYAPPPVPVTPPPVPVTPPPVPVTPPPASVAPPPVSVTPPPASVTPPPASVTPESPGPATTRCARRDTGASTFVGPAHASIGTDTTELDARKLGTRPATVTPRRSSPPPSTWASENPTVISAGPGRHGARLMLRRLGRALRAGGRKSPGDLVVALGLLARRRPLAVSVGTVASALAFAVTLSGAVRLAGYDERRSSRPAAVAMAKPKAPLALPSVAAAPAVVPSLVIRSAPPPPADSATPKARARGVVVDPEVAKAVADLASGRDAQARTAYTRLAARSPVNPAYEALSTLLARAASPDCEKKKAGTEAPCPEVKR